MTFTEFNNSPRQILKAAYKMFTDENAPAQVEVWYTSLKQYDLGLVEAAVRHWIQTQKFKPTPAEIIALMPSKKYEPGDHFDSRPRYEKIGGKIVQTFQCMKCRDSGMIMIYDKEKRLYGLPCDCAAGHKKFTWGWLSPEAQMEYIQRNGNHGETVGEDWYAQNEALKHGRIGEMINER